jgi:streptomycin 6-kinase
MAIAIPRRLACAVDPTWVAALPEAIEAIAARWALTLGAPFRPGGYCAWVAPARDRTGRELILKVGWRHLEAEHEAEALRVWDGDGAVRCLAAETWNDTSALLLERCLPGIPLGAAMDEGGQDVVVAGLLRRLWAHRPPDGHPFRPLSEMCDAWADSVERDATAVLARETAALLRELPRSAGEAVLLCTDLHAENILAAEREPWLVIDPKPFIGDPAYDVVQHMLNCDRRLAHDPVGLATRLADLLELDRERVRLWLFARCAQEAVGGDETMREPARRLSR